MSLISSTRFLNLRATFRLFPKWTKTDLPFDDSNYHIESVAEKLIPKIRRKLGLQDGRCKPCEETIYGIYNEQNVPEMFSTDIRFYTSEHCQEDVISQRMNLLLQNQIKMMFGRDHVTLNVAADTPDEYDTNFINAPVRHYMTLKYCPRGSKTLDLNRFNGCPSVSLNQENYASLMQQAKDTSERRNINELFKFESNETKLFSITNNFTAQVCFESYLTVLPRENTGVAEISKTTPVLIIVLISIKSWIR